MRFVLRLIGFILMTIGVLVILYALWSSYELFTGKKPAPIIFNNSQQQDAKIESGDINSGTAGAETIIGGIAKGLATAIPSEYLAIILNMVSWSVLAFIMIFGGSQLARMGIGLLSSA